MAASPSDIHYVPLGHSLTECGEAASGAGGVMFRTHIPENVTCRACRVRARLHGKPTKSATSVAQAGRVLQRAGAKYGSIGQHMAKTKGPMFTGATHREGNVVFRETTDGQWVASGSFRAKRKRRST